MGNPVEKVMHVRNFPDVKPLDKMNIMSQDVLAHQTNSYKSVKRHMMSKTQEKMMETMKNFHVSSHGDFMILGENQRVPRVQENQFM